MKDIVLYLLYNIRLQFGYKKNLMGQCLKKDVKNEFKKIFFKLKMSYCNCYCCQGRGCTKQYIGYFDTYVSNCLSSKCTQVFPQSCVIGKNISKSISAEFTNFSHIPPNSQHKSNILPKSNILHNLMIVFYIILGLLSVFSLIVIIHYIIDYIKKKNYIRITYVEPQENIPLPLPPPPYTKTPEKKQKKQHVGTSIYNFDDIYIHIERTPVHIDTYPVTNSR